MCIGDGYIFVFREAMEATYFAAYLAHLIEVMVANRQLPVNFHFRMGVHVGPVYTFWELLCPDGLLSRIRTPKKLLGQDRWPM